MQAPIVAPLPVIAAISPEVRMGAERIPKVIIMVPPVTAPVIR